MYLPIYPGPYAPGPDGRATEYALRISEETHNYAVMVDAATGDWVACPYLCRLDNTDGDKGDRDLWTDGCSGANLEVMAEMGLPFDPEDGHITAEAVAWVRHALMPDKWPKPGEPTPKPARMFTRRHYRAVAGTLRQAFLDEYARRSEDKDAHLNTETVGAIVRRMATAFEADNPRFVRALFYAEAGCCEDGTPDYSIGDNPDTPASPEGE